jgi:hypothetical protein
MVLSGGRLAKETNNDGGVKDFTVTPVTDEDDKIHNAQDVNVVNAGDRVATAAKQDTLYNLLNAEIIDDVTLHDASTENGDGSVITIGEYATLSLSITGANVTTSTLTFYISDTDGNYTLIHGVNPASLNVATSTSTVAATPGEKWVFDVKGFTGFKAVLSNLTGTNASVTVKGTLRM